MRFEGLPPSPPFAPLPVYARAFLLGSLPPFGKKTSEKPTTTSPRYYYASSISVLLPPFPQYSSREEPRKQRESLVKTKGKTIKTEALPGALAISQPPN